MLRNYIMDKKQLYFPLTLDNRRYKHGDSRLYPNPDGLPRLHGPKVVRLKPHCFVSSAGRYSPFGSHLRIK